MGRSTISLLAALATLATLALGGSGVSAQTVKTAPAPSKIVPVETFAQFPQIEDPRISPGGTLIATKVRAGGGQALAIVRLGAGGKPEIITRDEGEATDKLGARQIGSWRWIDDEHLLISLIFRDNLYGNWFDVQRFVVYDHKTKRATPLAWSDTILSQDVLWTSDSGPPHLLIERANSNTGSELLTRPEVIDIAADSGRSTIVQRINPIVSDWIADSDGVVRVGSSYDRDNGKLRMLYRSSVNENLHTIINGRTDRYDDTAAPSLLLRGGKAYAYSRKDGYRALYDYDLSTMTLGKKVFGVDGYDIDGASVNGARNGLDGVTVTERRQHIIYLDPRLKEIQGLLEESYGKGNVAIQSVDRNREKIVFSVAKPGQSPGFYVFDTVGGGIGLLGWQNETLKDAMLNPVSMVHYPTSDGKTIEAVLTMPRHRTGEKNLPLVILPHGGPWARDSEDWDPYSWAQAIAELGYVVIQPNFRGSTGYGREWEKAAEGNWGYRMSDDLNDAIPWLASKGIADAKRVCMFGWSYGGYAAARAAQRDGDKYRCTIAGAAPVDMPAMIAHDKNYLGRYGAKQALGSASNNLIDISPALHAEQVSSPILIVQGAKDLRVPVAQARGFVARLKKAGKVEGRDYVYLEQPNNTHNLLRQADRIQLLEAIRDFLAKHNPA